MPAESKRRSAQGDDSARARAGRNRKATVSLPAAATSRRLTWRASMRAAQHSTLPRAPLDKACSAAHKASFVRFGETTMSRARSIPEEVQAGACSACGGATSSDHFPWPPRRASDGIISEHSPMPTRSDRTSVSVPRGQPPPGSSASSAAKPLANAGRGALARPLARQTSGRARTSARETGAAEIIGNSVENYCNYIQQLAASAWIVSPSISVAASDWIFSRRYVMISPCRGGRFGKQDFSR